MSEPLDCPVTDIDPFSDDFLENPFPRLAELRGSGDAFYFREYGVWGVARHDLVDAVLRDHETFSNAAGVGYSNLLKETPWRAPSIILEADPPLHSTTRGVFTRILSPRALRDLRDRFAAEAEALVDSLVQRETFDVVADLAQAYVLKVFPDSLGLPAENRENLLTYGGVTFDSLGPRNARFDEAMDRAARIRPWVEATCARGALTPGGFGAQIYEAADTGTVSDEQAGMLVRSFLTAGVDTTVSALGFAIRRFIEHPDQWAMLRADPTLVRSAFDEVVRIDSPVIGFFRTTTTEARIGSVTVPADAKVMVFFAGGEPRPRPVGRPGPLRHHPTHGGSHRFRCGYPRVRRTDGRQGRGRGSSDGAGAPCRQLGAGRAVDAGTQQHPACVGESASPRAHRRRRSRAGGSRSTMIARHAFE
ncbi:cytochrome P450 [Gordonia humi]